MLNKKYLNQNCNPLTDNSLHEEIKFRENLKYVPINNDPSYIKVGMLILCLKGSARLTVYDNVHVLAQNELAIIFPGQLVSLTEISDDFLTDTLIISHSLFDDAVNGLTRFSPHFFFYMRSNYWYSVADYDKMRFKDYYQLIQTKVTNPHYRFKREVAIYILRIFYLDVYNDYCDKAFILKDTLDVRKGELAHDFFYLLMENYRQYRDVAYYADKMCITPKYLSAVIKEVSGKTAKDWIVEYIILEVKRLLRDSSLNILEIAMQADFSNQSSLGRFFRKHTGMTLTDYRMNK